MKNMLEREDNSGRYPSEEISYLMINILLAPVMFFEA